MGGGKRLFYRRYYPFFLSNERSRHLMTGVGAYFYITWGIWLRHCLNGRHDEFELVWPSILTSLPTVRRKRDRSSTMNIDGNIKKKDL